MEIWKNIKGYEGKYQVSSFGNVRALDYKVNTLHGQRMKKGHMLKPTNNGNGYLIVSLSSNGTRKNYYIHRLVAESFLDNPNKCEQVNHKDYNTFNNHLDNLEWLTAKENVIYSLPNRPKMTKTANKYGKYIRLDKRYNSFVVVVPTENKSRKYLGSFKTLEEAIKCRDKHIRIYEKEDFNTLKNIFCDAKNWTTLVNDLNYYYGVDENGDI